MSSPYGLYKLGNKRVTMITTKSYANKSNLKQILKSYRVRIAG